MAQSKIINESKSGNYILENKIFILDDFSSRSSNELIEIYQTWYQTSQLNQYFKRTMKSQHHMTKQ